MPGPIFNNGKPFYVEKDPVTGVIDFNNKSPAGKQQPSFLNEYDYIEEEPSTDIFDKANIDRKDGNYGSHRPNDINQLTPNFHDFLNLPVKYNPDKYVYPLISSSYANTKIQGNVNRYNHKNYGSTAKPTVSPMYYTTKESIYYKPKDTHTTESHIQFTTTSPTTTTVAASTTKLPSNLLNSPMNHPSYFTTEENEYDYDYFTTKPPKENIKTDKPKFEKPTTTHRPYEKPTTTHRPYSIFDELFGDYEDPKPIKPPSIFSSLPAFGDKIIKNEKETTNDITTTSSGKQNETSLNTLVTHNSHGIPISGGSNYNKDEYDYEDYFSAEEENIKKTTTHTVTPSEIKTSTSIVTESSMSKKPEKVQAVYSNFHQNYGPIEATESHTNKINESKPTEKPSYISITTLDDNNFNEEEPVTKSTKVTFAPTPPALKVTSMPLGDNHPSPVGIKMPPIIAMSNQNLKQQLFNEKVDITTKATDINNSSKQGNVPNQDTEGYESNQKKETFISNSFRPLYTPHNQVQVKPEVNHNGEIKETLTFTGTGQINSNYSWTVPTQNNYDSYSNDFDTIPIKNAYNQEIHSNYSWTVPESTTHKKYIPEQSNIKYTSTQTNSLYKPVQNNYNLQQVSSGYSVGQPVASYGQGTVFNVGLSTNYKGGSANTKFKIPHNTNYQYTQVGTNYNMTVYPEATSSVNIHPLRGSEASLSIGTPTSEVKTVPGQVMDEKLDLKDEELRKKPSNKIVFPEDDASSTPNREILSLYSKPMLHQLPADLTPPSEQEIKPQPARPTNIRPPWDPRPGHFYQGRPEYARPPRPPIKQDIFKRIDGLPNILPQFRPNAKVPTSHYHDNILVNPGYMQRQPLLERPSNRPIGFFEKLHPPPPPKRILELRKPVTLNQHLMQNEQKERHNEPTTQKSTPLYKAEHYKAEQYPFQSPPKVPVANRRTGEEESEIATLQMLHAKQTDKLNTIKPNVPPPFKINYKETTDKPLYVVYPVNTSPLKLDVLDNEKETVVIGTRGGENPLPPSKINKDFPTYTDQKPILKPKDRNDSPILKPHSKPTSFPIKTDFPYPLERPDPTTVYAETTLTNKGTVNNLDNPDFPKKYHNYQSNNQWTTLEAESRIINGNKLNYANEPISVTLKTYTASPIAIAYTPTEPSDSNKYSLPNYGSAVISEIRNDNGGEIINGKNKVHKQGIVSNAGSEFTVSAVMHTHTQNNMMLGTTVPKSDQKLENHKIEPEVEPQYPTKLEFQAPFQASINIGSQSNGWSVIRDKSKDIDRADNDITTLLPETTSEFDIENFKPQMFGGFKPIYDFPEEKEVPEDDSDLSAGE